MKKLLAVALILLLPSVVLGGWNQTTGGGTSNVSNLNDLSDVDVPSPSSGEVVQYTSGSKWEARTIAGSGDVSGPATSVTSSVVIFLDDGGKTIASSSVVVSGGYVDAPAGFKVGGSTLSASHVGASALSHLHSEYQTSGQVDNAIVAKGYITSGQVAPLVTFENLDANGDVGTSGDQVASGNHQHPSVYASASHVAQHELGGIDEMDGDHLDIDFTPSNYTPSTAPAEASNADHLAAHLAGIDNALVGATSPGTDTQVLFNDAGSTSGDAGLVYDKNTDRLHVSGGMVIGSSSATSPNFVLGSDISPSEVATGSIWRGTWKGENGYWLWDGIQIVNLAIHTRIVDVSAVASNTAVATNSNVAGDFRIPLAGTLSHVAAYVDSAPGVPMKIYLLNGGSNILSTPIWIDASEEGSNTALTPAVISTSTVSAYDAFTISTEVVGGAEGLHVILGIDTYSKWVN